HGTYEIVVIADSADQISESNPTNNVASATLQVTLADYADLAASVTSLTNSVIDDPATIRVTWQVTNNGTGRGRTSHWVDNVYLSSNDSFGGDTLIGTFEHDGFLDQHGFYTRTEDILLPKATSGTFHI